MRLLLVEDDRMLGATVERALRQQGHAMDWVQDGPSAEEALSGEPYQVVLLDLGLPRKGGLQVLRDLRRRPSSSDGSFSIPRRTRSGSTGSRSCSRRASSRSCTRSSNTRAGRSPGPAWRSASRPTGTLGRAGHRGRALSSGAGHRRRPSRRGRLLRVPAHRTERHARRAGPEPADRDQPGRATILRSRSWAGKPTGRGRSVSWVLGAWRC